MTAPLLLYFKIDYINYSKLALLLVNVHRMLLIKMIGERLTMRRDEFTMEDQQEIEDFLSGMSFGFRTADEEGIPRVTPLNYAYVNGAFIFMATGWGKMDHLRRTPAVCFTIADEYAPDPFLFLRSGDGLPATAYFKSVTAVGEVVIVDDLEEKPLRWRP